MNNKKSMIIVGLAVLVVILGIYFFPSNRKEIDTTVVPVAPVVSNTDKLSTIYISSPDVWPPKVTTSATPFTCPIGGSEIKVNGMTEQKEINGKIYCVTIESEGAAGSVYTTYTYTTKFEAGVKKLSFILRATQCANYDEPQQSACKAERVAFNPDQIADAIVSAN
ncbi:MAG: hypothetical protein WCO58_01395 [bacterium]